MIFNIIYLTLAFEQLIAYNPLLILGSNRTLLPQQCGPLLAELTEIMENGKKNGSSQSEVKKQMAARTELACDQYPDVTINAGNKKSTSHFLGKIKAVGKQKKRKKPTATSREQFSITSSSQQQSREEKDAKPVNSNKHLGGGMDMVSVSRHLSGPNIRKHQIRMEEILMTDATLSDCEEQFVVEADWLIAQQSVRKKQRKFEEKKNKEEKLEWMEAHDRLVRVFHKYDGSDSKKVMEVIKWSGRNATQLRARAKVLLL